MSDVVIKIEDLHKKYKLGTIGGGTLTQDLQSWWANIRGKEDPNTIIGTKKVSKNQTFMALNGVSFKVNKGDTVGIIGGNGAGKSTMLKVLSRVTAPTSGTIKVKGRISSMLEVGTGFHGELTGRENVYLNGAILGMSKEEVDKKIDAIIAFSECEKFIDTPVKRYSSGMYVKLAFSVAAHLDSEILVMDEVLAVGDMKFQEKCLDKMKDVAGDGRTILYVSHNMRTVQQLCNRVIVLHHGKVIFNGDVEEGIKIYLDNNANISLFQDFKLQKRKTILNNKIKMESCEILNKQEAIFKQGDKVNFRLTYKAKESIKNVRLRAEVLYADDTAAGTSLSMPLIDVNRGDLNSDKFELDISRLAPGKYTVVFVLYQNNKFGSFSDIDRVENGLVFEVIDDNDDTIEWKHRWWGHIKLSEIKKLN